MQSFGSITDQVFHKEVMWDKTVRYVEMAASKEDDQDMEEFLDKKSRRKKNGKK